MKSIFFKFSVLCPEPSRSTRIIHENEKYVQHKNCENILEYMKNRNLND